MDWVMDKLDVRAADEEPRFRRAVLHPRDAGKLKQARAKIDAYTARRVADPAGGRRRREESTTLRK